MIAHTHASEITETFKRDFVGPNRVLTAHLPTYLELSDVYLVVVVGSR